MLAYLTIGILVVVIAVLCFLLADQARTTAQYESSMADLVHRDRVDSRARFLEVIKQGREDYRAMAESYLRSEGKPYIPPVPVSETVAGSVDRGQRPPNVAPHAFKMKPSPPLVPKT